MTEKYDLWRLLTDGDIGGAVSIYGQQQHPATGVVDAGQGEGGD